MMHDSIKEITRQWPLTKRLEGARSQIWKYKRDDEWREETVSRSHTTLEPIVTAKFSPSKSVFHFWCAEHTKIKSKYVISQPFSLILFTSLTSPLHLPPRIWYPPTFICTSCERKNSYSSTNVMHTENLPRLDVNSSQTPLAKPPFYCINIISLYTQVYSNLRDC